MHNHPFPSSHFMMGFSLSLLRYGILWAAVQCSACPCPDDVGLPPPSLLANKPSRPVLSIPCGQAKCANRVRAEVLMLILPPSPWLKFLGLPFLGPFLVGPQASMWKMIGHVSLFAGKCVHLLHPNLYKSSFFYVKSYEVFHNKDYVKILIPDSKFWLIFVTACYYLFFLSIHSSLKADDIKIIA